MKKSQVIHKISRHPKFDGGFLRECTPEMRDDEDVVIAAIKRGYNTSLESNKAPVTPRSDQSVLINSKRLRLPSSHYSSSPLQFASERLRRDPEIALLALV